MISDELKLQQHLERELASHGRTVVIQLFVLLKTAQNYPEGHSALKAPVAGILSALTEIRRMNEEGSLRMMGGHLFVGEVRLKADSTAVDPFLFILDMMKRFGIGTIRFADGVPAAEVMRLAYVLRDAEGVAVPQDAYAQVLAGMHEKGITRISLEAYGGEAEAPEIDPDEVDDPKVKAKKVYLHTLAAVSEVMDNAKMGQTLRLRRSKRVVQGMIDQLLAAETNLMGLTTIRSHDDYTYHHSVNVCILSLAMGQRLGFPKAKLFELGMAALFHDIGKSEIPEELLNKPTEFTEEEWGAVRRHPVLGVRKLMKLKGLDILTSRIVTGAFEHHLNYDLSGYPRYPYRGVSLFARIISIADCYDGLTSSRVYARTPRAPDAALRYMLDRAGTVYDPLLMKVFVNCIGIFPLGTLVRLSTRELAVVVANSGNPESWGKPVVRVITDATGREADGGVRDLSLVDTPVVKTIDPYRYRLDPAMYMV
ncbi:MAG TPA: HD-GYP domain-containing protein [Verrucomicrobiae bacterium]|nr:HD-GYP domain-containing protein [Verrucomicrobiae bacterium]